MGMSFDLRPESWHLEIGSMMELICNELFPPVVRMASFRLVAADYVIRLYRGNMKIQRISTLG